MQQLKEDFEEKYLEYMEPYHSEETIKNRRNLLVASFVIVALSFVDIPLDKIRLFADMSGASHDRIYIVALAMIGYWHALYIFLWIRDLDIQKERKLLLLGLANAVDERMNEIKKEIDTAVQLSAAIRREQKDLKRTFERYAGLKTRMRRALQYTKTTSRVMGWLPIVAGTIAIVVLVIGLFPVK